MDTNLLSIVARLSDDALLARVRDLAAREREATAVLVAHLAELEERQLHLEQGYSSLFGYCTQVLHLSEYAAYARIAAARAVRRFPALLELLAAGVMTLTTVELLAPHLTEANHREVLEEARYRSKRQVEEIIARLNPRPDVPASLRRLPSPQGSVVAATMATDSEVETNPVLSGPSSPTPSGLPSEASTSDLVFRSDIRASARPLDQPPIGPAFSTSTPRQAMVEPLAPERYKVTFTVDKETYDRLRFAQALLRHQIPDGDIAAIFSHALKAHVERALQQKVAVTERPRGAGGPTNLHSRHIPAEVKRAVWLRDGGRCAYVSRTGRRCKEEGFLQFHHRKAFADGGEATAENVELRCAAHNRYEAEQVFGPRRTRAVRERAVRWQAVSVESTTGSGPSSSDPTRSFDIARGMPWNQRKAASSGAGARLRPG